MTPTPPIRVLIADDHTMVRSGLRMFLLAFDDMTLVGEASNGEEALLMANKLRPDVILMDLIMPTMDGIRATREIRDICPGTQIIALTSFPDPELMQEALQAGAISYLLKNVSANELAGAIRAAQAGRPILSPEAARMASEHTAPPMGIHELTPREREVLTLLTSGMSNAEITQTLVVSLSTVKFHVSSILQKLGVQSRAEAVSVALQHHLVDSTRPMRPPPAGSSPEY